MGAIPIPRLTINQITPIALLRRKKAVLILALLPFLSLSICGMELA
jgi:hypothetical protein